MVSSKDDSLYVFDGERYNKRQLVLAVIKRYVQDHPKATISSLKTVFPDDLMKGYFGVIQDEAFIAQKDDKRYLREIIKLSDGTCVRVCGEWRIELMKDFIAAARAAGYIIK